MTDEVIVAVEERVGRLRLNRPKALHALTHGMCTAMAEALLAWRADPGVEAVLIDHAEGRGFCAGGDVRAAAESAGTDGAEARRFFFDEYRLNHLLFTYAKPIVALMDGVTMGGGVGLALPARYRVATERTILAMPETTIGLFPDVGGGWYLSRLPGRIGQYLALTGARVDGADALALGLATHFAADVDAIKAGIVADPQAIAAVLAANVATPPEAAILQRRAEIDRLFACDTLEDILATLDADPGAWAAAQRAVLATRSPQSMKVALRQLAAATRFVDFADEMRMEYGIVTHVIQRPDFAEGVRALLIDKDNAPRWDPPTAESVTDHMIDTIFAPLPDDEQWEPFRL